MKIQLIRHATLWLEYAGTTFLVDPMFSDQGANPPIINSGNDHRNPLCPLPGPVEQWVMPDAVLVTHLHQDHWDAAAAERLPHELPLLCQEGDEEKLRTQGFQNVSPIGSTHRLAGISINRTSGRHGTGEIGERMGKVSGFVLEAEGEPKLYLAGDTIWCSEVEQTLDAHRPDCIIVNAGGARFTVGDPITMSARDVVAVSHAAPDARIIAVHMDAINHCLVTRERLRQELGQAGLLERVEIPEDGEWL